MRFWEFNFDNHDDVSKVVCHYQQKYNRYHLDKNLGIIFFQVGKNQYKIEAYLPGGTQGSAKKHSELIASNFYQISNWFNSLIYRFAP